MIFFKPTKKFLDWIVVYAAGRIVFDVGCGDAHLVKTLLARKVKTIGFEPTWGLFPDVYDPLLPVLPFEGQSSALLRDQAGLVLFARPCHNRFTEEVESVLHPDSEVLYIGLGRNRDLDFEHDRLTLLKRSVGKDREMCWRVARSACLATTG